MPERVELWGSAFGQVELVAEDDALDDAFAVRAQRNPKVVDERYVGEPKRLRLRLFSAAGRLVRGGRRLRLRLAQRWPWAGQVTAAITRLQAIPSG